MALVPVICIKDSGGYVVDSDDIPPPVGFGLQEAYDNGQTVNQTVLDTPIEITTGISDAAIEVIKNTGSNIPAIFVHGNGNPDPGLRIESDSTSIITDYNLSSVSFGSQGGGNISRIETSSAQPTFQSDGLSLRTGVADDGTLAGPVSIGFSIGATEDGGFNLNPATGRIELRKHALGVPGVDEVGTLGLISVTAAQEALIAPAVGDIHRRSDAGAGVSREQGIRAYENGSFGLVCRGYQRTFTNADLVGAVLSVIHSLTTNAPVFMIYSNTGALVIPGAATYTAAEISANQIDNTFNALLLPLVGIWRVTLIGF